MIRNRFKTAILISLISFGASCESQNQADQKSDNSDESKQIREIEGNATTHDSISSQAKILSETHVQAAEGEDSDNSTFKTFRNPLSTFSIDVDTASYTYFRSALTNNSITAKDIRLEEWINYFDYSYPTPEEDEDMAVSMEMALAPWNKEKKLFKISLRGRNIKEGLAPRANLVFLIDVSGSMSPNLDLLKGAFETLIPNLKKEDRISIITYAGADKIVLEPTDGDKKQKIIKAISKLKSGGGTNGAAGIKTAYEMAEKNYFHDGVNRVLLATDGDFNIGISSTQNLTDLVTKKADTGIELSVLGFGAYGNDQMMESISNNGNGNYSFIDNANEATKVLNSELNGTLYTIAKDVKLQVEFNPRKIANYRLVGYENRILSHEDFDNDKVDAGDMGADHKVTAIYEIELQDEENPPEIKLSEDLLKEKFFFVNEDGTLNDDSSSLSDYAAVKIRYKKTKAENSQLYINRFAPNENGSPSEDLIFASAVIALGSKIKKDKDFKEFDFDTIISLARQGQGDDLQGQRQEFIDMCHKVKKLSK